MAQEQNWHLRRVAGTDTDALHELLCIPEVYRYLADNVKPPRAGVEQWIAQSDRDFNSCGIGLWLLEDGRGQLAGCVRLEVDAPGRSAELSYVLHPQFWGLGLATRMSWSAIQLAFARNTIDHIIAGADSPNTASFAVMRRLGMTFLRDVQYPMGPGAEYIFHRTDPAPSPVPQEIVEYLDAR
jgi:[ribosomal protein S5]-alanine N-acetyltransferase